MYSIKNICLDLHVPAAVPANAAAFKAEIFENQT